MWPLTIRTSPRADISSAGVCLPSYFVNPKRTPLELFLDAREDLVHTGTADGACALGSRTARFDLNFLYILHFALSFALHTISNDCFVHNYNSNG